MIRAELHPDGYTVRLDITDGAERLLDRVALAYAADEQLVGELLRELAAAADHHRARKTDPRADDVALDWSGAALDAARARARAGVRGALLRWAHRRRRGAVLLRRRAALVDELPGPDGLLAADLSYRAAAKLGRRLQQLAERTVAGRHLIELEYDR
ncbi:hypothetical protein SAMN05216371_3833 [Streptomyces sp. TLI_053]|uniref:hypothetical protein n=1 Tax=Streptomyces sp. TLI_053 TaxID=1855352 RepID=UPI00087BAEF7|nr:hypothetical protein [Streptomyces sp. TLI_053]SDT69604.1 hypothetical protein SAMN05216371_3833 [Streptomyces sp. TLI_053]